MQRRINLFLSCSILMLMASRIALAEEPCIGVITAGSGEKFWSTLAEGAIEAGEKYGYQVISRGPKLEANYIAQAEIIKYFEKRGCVGLVLAPNTSTLHNEVIRIKKKGVIVVFVDRPLKTLPEVALFTTDNFSAGKLAAEKLIAKLSPEQKNIAVFRLEPNIETTTQREDGFIKTALEHGKHIVVEAHVGTYLPDIIDNTLAQLGKLSVPLHGAFSPNEDSTVAVISALNYLKLQTMHVGFDHNAFIDKAINEKRLLGTIVQQPHAMGFSSVEAIHHFIVEAKPPTSIFLDVQFLTAK